VYCVDASTGEEVWKAEVTKGRGINSSPVVVDDGVVVLAGVLTAFDAKTGEVRWRQEAVKGSNNSPQAWECDGVSYVVCQSGRNVVCVHAADGKVAWSVKAGSHASAVVSGNHMAVVTGKKASGFLGYEISATEAREVWRTAFADVYSSPVIDGDHAYAAGKKQAICVDWRTGKALWSADIGTADCSSPLLAGDKLITLGRGGVLMARTTPEKPEVLSSFKCAAVRGGSVALSGGKLYVRMGKSVACYDLCGTGTP
jgi:outer membrane protein assembly factor BamB